VMIASRLANPSDTARRAAEIARSVAPLDLAWRAVYVVPYSRALAIAPELCGELLCGWTSLAADVRLRPLLDQLGLWEGRGFACLVNDCLLGDAAAFIGTALHELAHFLTFARSHCETITAAAVEQLASELAWPAPSAPDPNGPKWRANRRAAHCGRFHRAAVHLSHRAAAFGIHEGHLHFAGDNYDLSSPREYMAALANECAATAGASIAELLDSPAPSQFVELWERDNAPARIAEREAERQRTLDALSALLEDLDEQGQVALLRAVFDPRADIATARAEAGASATPPERRGSSQGGPGAPARISSCIFRDFGGNFRTSSSSYPVET
jgi:hypothetical protein